MTHQQILDKLASKALIQNIDDDFARLTAKAMAYAKHDTKIAENLTGYILPKILLRWNCVLNADHTEVTDNYKRTTFVALAVILHKYGLKDSEITEKAIEAIDALNRDVVLSDDFFRKSDQIKKLISSEPVPLRRKPSLPDNITFYRPKDVIAIQLDKHFYCAYIHTLSRPNESPIIEFYDNIFDKVPEIQELEKLPAKGKLYNDGSKRISKYAVSGIKFLPDLANQIKLIGSNVESSPSNAHLEESVGLYAVIDIFEIQNEIERLFS
ncbi:MAG TPA: hypothetical protein VF465_19065 [Flavobacterium sp.]|uniref:hypothetical protein n=1 Tax=Flavobacterium sp. TaxID=239 RepID=UPI002ED255B6